jgi:dTDP-glucose 4,6-dehydratase
MSRRPRSLVTGGAGFVGSHLCARLLQAGHEVLAVDNLCTGARENLAPLRGHAGFAFLEQDVTEYLAVPGPLDYILHFASPASPVDYLRLPIQTLKVGALGTHRALGLAKATGATFLLASTSEVYGDPQVHPQPETYWGHVNPVGPRGVYDEAKRFAEALTMAYHRAHGLPTRIARIFNTYGPHMRPHDGRVVSNFCLQALTGTPLTLYGDGSQTRSFCYVSDLVEGLLRLLVSAEVEPVNLGNPTERPVRDLVTVLAGLLGHPLPVTYAPLPVDDPRVRQPDITRARDRLGWTPRVSLEAGLRETLAYFRARGVGG